LFLLARWHANLAESLNNPKQGAPRGRKKENQKSSKEINKKSS
jgi:hypothetical protein